MLLAMPAHKFAERAITKRLKKVKSLWSNIEHLKLSERYELRKRLKSLKYSVGFFAALYPKKQVAKQQKTLSELQDVFGSLNDLAVAEEIVRTLTEKAKGTENALPIASGGGRVLGWHSAHADLNWTQIGRAHV